MRTNRAEAIARLVGDHPYTVVDGRSGDRWGHLVALGVEHVSSRLGGVELKFLGHDEPIFIYEDWLFVEPDGTIRAGKDGTWWMPLVFRLVPNPGADQPELCAAAQAINAQFGDD